MQPIYPVTEQTCRAHYGKPVLIYLNDGRQIFGELSRIEKDTLVLNDNTTSKVGSSKKKAKSVTTKSKKVKTKKTTASTQPTEQGYAPEGYPPLGFQFFGSPNPGYQGAFHVPVASIVALFG
ncbi:hypothetical protein [Paenibacillus sp. N3.4]|uniref:hypothetical protein n=1 Tax=Paenibacillus sp. N3.4 TaxID=2603222 RepID=UPI0011C87006|nr:hypothetical protein [Paenibacillus sp. N3.4]TXK75132.1 hypothetical protein FU659_27905 [Paenibacillus sp. N3.4]